MGCRKLQIQDYFTLRTSQNTPTNYTYAHENHEKHLTKIDQQLLVHIQTLLKILSGICELRTNSPIFHIIIYTYDTLQDKETKPFLSGKEMIFSKTNVTTNACRNSSDDKIAENYKYSPFSKLTISTKTMDSKFTSYSTDNKTDLVYSGYRYYDADMGRWINRDPIEERGGVNVYGFVGNDGVNKGDRLGLKIESQCIDAYLKKNKITAFKRKLIKKGDKEYYLYEDSGIKPDVNNLINEILSVMIMSEHTFVTKGETINKAIDSLKANIKARKEIIANTNKLKNLQFGIGIPIPPGTTSDDIYKDPSKYSMGCKAAYTFVTSGKTMHYIRSKFFIPGDGGYIANIKHTMYTTLKNTNNSAIGEEGENIIYQGSWNFFGHNSVKKIQSLAGFEKFVDSFRNGGKHDTWDIKHTVLTGLKTLRIKGNLQWEKGWTANPYANGSPQPGGWMSTEWPK